MKVTRIIHTPEGDRTLDFTSNGRGLRHIMLDGSKIGFAHTTYDGWYGTAHYREVVHPSALGRNLNVMADKFAKDFERKLNALPRTITAAREAVALAESQAIEARQRFDATQSLGDKLDVQYRAMRLDSAQTVLGWFVAANSERIAA